MIDIIDDTIEFNGVRVATFNKHPMASFTELADFTRFVHEAQSKEDLEYELSNERETSLDDAHREGKADGVSEGLRGGFDHTVDILHGMLSDNPELSLAEAIKELDFTEVQERHED